MEFLGVFSGFRELRFSPYVAADRCTRGVLPVLGFLKSFAAHAGIVMGEFWYPYPGLGCLKGARPV